MIEIKRYFPKYKKEWDNLLTRSRIDTFLFYRDYMDYHSERYRLFLLGVQKRQAARINSREYSKFCVLFPSGINLWGIDYCR